MLQSSSFKRLLLFIAKFSIHHMEFKGPIKKNVNIYVHFYTIFLNGYTGKM